MADSMRPYHRGISLGAASLLLLAAFTPHRGVAALGAAPPRHAPAALAASDTTDPDEGDTVSHAPTDNVPLADDGKPYTLPQRSTINLYLTDSGPALFYRFTRSRGWRGRTQPRDCEEGDCQLPGRELRLTAEAIDGSNAIPSRELVVRDRVIGRITSGEKRKHDRMYRDCRASDDRVVECYVVVTSDGSNSEVLALLSIIGEGSSRRYALDLRSLHRSFGLCGTEILKPARAEAKFKECVPHGATVGLVPVSFVSYHRPRAHMLRSAPFWLSCAEGCCS